jgi:transcriptional regulator with PAS, ATPase and Fis domain
LIRGESGTGKELVARAIHFSGPRCKYPFVPINCAAIPKDLMESELFGHEKGAFTGAGEAKPGKFEVANRGTVFLDEIADMDMTLQAKLLRVLEYGEFERVGGVKGIRVDVRIIAATNKDLEEEVKRGRFREDLFFRLNVFPLHIPPLRERREDILPLARYFVEYYSEELKKPVPKISNEAQSLLISRDWKGNVRELKNAIERAMILLDSDTLGPELFGSDSIRGFVPESDSLKEVKKTSISAVEKERILKALVEAKWNKWKAAKLLKVSYKTLLTKIKAYEIEAPEKMS